MKHAIKYRVRKTKSSNAPDWVWVVKTEWGPSSSSGYMWQNHSLGQDLMTFASVPEAKAFIEAWDGHPNDRLKGDAYEIVEVKPRMVTYQQGWLRA